MIRSRVGCYEFPSKALAEALAELDEARKPVVAGGRAACTSLPSQAEIHGPRRDEPAKVK